MSESGRDVSPFSQTWRSCTLSSRFYEWVGAIDPALRKAASSPSAWLHLTLLVSATIAVIGLIPGPREFFSLEVAPSIALFGPTLLLGAWGGALEKRNRLSARAYGLIALANSALLQSFAWSLVTGTRMPGSAVLGIFPISVAAFHGHLYLCSPRYAFLFASIAVAAIYGIVSSPSEEHLWVVLLGSSGSMGLALVLGTIAANGQRLSVEADALRSAVQAQILEEQAREVESLSEALLQVRAQSHDAGTTLSSVLINVQSLLRRVESRGDTRGDDLADVATDLKEGLTRLQALLHETQMLETRPLNVIEEVDLEEVSERVLAEARSRHPNVDIVRAPTRDESPLKVAIHGGNLSLYRMLSNLVNNACEGDGKRKATHVRVEISHNSPAGVCIAIRDDGPGFSDVLLDRRSARLHTTKPRGTGLGLYTTERLARANHGTLTLSNPAGGGALATLRLPGKRL